VPNTSAWDKFADVVP